MSYRFFSNDKFLEFISRKIVIFMKEKQIPLGAIFREDVLESIPRCNDIYRYLNWDYDNKTGNVKWYSSINNFNKKDDSIYSLSFNFEAVKYKVFKNYILYNITWRNKDVE